MPELPEVEVVRRGLANWVLGARIADIDVLEARSLRRHLDGPDDFVAGVRMSTITDVVRRGKFLWLVLDHPDTAEPTAMVAHLGMSGQILLLDSAAPDERHLRIRMSLDNVGSNSPAQPGGSPVDELRFVDQRIFGGLQHAPMVPTRDGFPGGLSAHPEMALPLIPPAVAHIERDPLDPFFDAEAFSIAIRRRKTGLKRAILDQGLISGIGNIYADEALWLARLHYARPTEALTEADIESLLEGVREVMTAALDQGGTSFDALYVNVNGESGYFDRSLNVYGQAGEECRRCGGIIEREKFMNRSSYFCPVCQRPR
ncbi:bifunctional DNA-formamidopyrimidine glycosylase/DNA-(apurinic or apyrimidinic site) lyase [Saxibacter everestensis]|uniref:Formamidopyrimidine-DNA glycosylase n=1 Tax=Saxibacter everestensis TaxID=2909229 RepID=A0ABY8QVS1_9MICO|nr:bifunctional DNA-formamidopyrimidine glycosylase/DNA-(apurinic or apyrimidinic site) lyase [Brevibacteriaceae bacterium ZFBP1038]